MSERLTASWAVPVLTTAFLVCASTLRHVSARALARATELSVSHCSNVKKGERVPHPMWWGAFVNGAARLTGLEPTDGQNRVNGIA
jgi:hypothetical protein